MQRTPTPMAFIPTTVIFIVSGIGGLFWLFFRTEPMLGPRWLFFFFIAIGITGLFLPITSYLNYRFPSNPPVSNTAIVRQALWFGVYATILAWLQFGRVFNVMLAAIFFLGFIFIEVILLIWERTRWRVG